MTRVATCFYYSQPLTVCPGRRVARCCSMKARASLLTLLSSLSSCRTLVGPTTRCPYTLHREQLDCRVPQF